MNTLLIAILSVILSVAAQFSLKVGMNSEQIKFAVSHSTGASLLFAVLTNYFVMAGFFLYALGAIVWLKVLMQWDVSKAYPLVGLGFLLTMAIGILLGEAVTLMRVIGVLLICTGVVLVANS